MTVLVEMEHVYNEESVFGARANNMLACVSWKSYQNFLSSWVYLVFRIRRCVSSFVDFREVLLIM